MKILTPTPSPITADTPTTIPALLTWRRRSDRSLFALILVGALVVTPLLTLAGGVFGFGTIIALLGALLVTVLIVRWPVVGFFLTTACVVLIEQEALAFPIFTDRLNIFYWPPRLAGLPERPIGLLLLLPLFVVLCRRLATRQTPLQLGALFAPLALFIGCVVIGVLHGMAAGGDTKIIVLEVRPFEYLFLAYLLAYNLVATKQHLKLFFWIVILGAGVKSLQGMYIVYGILGGHFADKNEIMAHEESFFFAALLVLVVLFCLQYRYRAQLYTALAILPFLLIALVANNRRADYMAFLIGAVIAWVLVIVVASPRARTKHLLVFAFCAVLGSGYLVIFSHASGSFAEPARGIVASIHPDPSDTRDVLSNLYRDFENADLKYTAKQSPVIGWGFGRPFLQPLVLPNIITLDPYYLYIPHNTIYWIMMRLGMIGFFAFWYFIAAIIIRGVHILRRLNDRYLQLIAIYIVAITFMEIVVAYADYQLFFYRNVIYLGLLVGILMKLPAIDASSDASAQAVPTAEQAAQRPDMQPRKDIQKEAVAPR
ncbi:MAG: hypothetical protein OJF49_001943 [Ktedonobacterales bacterium]|jgi:O-antigen ligase|nr:MAG: hypothetical protein OJF49_001943 [Ktedonobacterales bacterium]